MFLGLIIGTSIMAGLILTIVRHDPRDPVELLAVMFLVATVRYTWLCFGPTMHDAD